MEAEILQTSYKDIKKTKPIRIKVRILFLNLIFQMYFKEMNEYFT